jgi:type II secretion system protein I
MRRFQPAVTGQRPPSPKEVFARRAFASRRKAPARRAGMTLLEVLISLAIFLLSLVAIGRLVSISSERAREVQLKGEAMLKCQSKLAEIIGGAEQLTSQSDVPFPEDPNWTWSADCNQGQVNNLWTVQVRVGKQRADGSRLEVTLSQMVLDPSVRGTTINMNAASGMSGGSGGTTTGGP